MNSNQYLEARLFAIAAAKYFGEFLVDELGQGTRGIAWQLTGGKVLKVTEDLTEFNTSLRIEGQKIPHINEVYACKVMKYRGVRRYVILQKLVDCSEYDLEAFEKQHRSIFDVQHDVCAYKHSLDLLEDDVNDSFFTESESFIAEQIVNITKSLVEIVHYRGRDCLPCNLGWDHQRKQLVMFDLGYSMEYDPIKLEPIILDK